MPYTFKEIFRNDPEKINIILLDTPSNPVAVVSDSIGSKIITIFSFLCRCCRGTDTDPA
jgi:hypothetical protein